MGRKLSRGLIKKFNIADYCWLPSGDLKYLVINHVLVGEIAFSLNGKIWASIMMFDAVFESKIKDFRNENLPNEFLPTTNATRVCNWIHEQKQAVIFLLTWAHSKYIHFVKDAICLTIFFFVYPIKYDYLYCNLNLFLIVGIKFAFLAISVGESNR